MSNEEPISLESYAAVTAGLGAGLSLSNALALAEVLPAAWEQAAEHWPSRIDESAASDLVMLVAFDAALLAARRRFEPTVEPIASDVRPWAHFRRHFVTAVDPVAFLAGHGLSLSVMARLEAAWAERIGADEALEASLREHLEAPLEPCPTITLTPSPVLSPRPRASTPPAEIVTREPAKEPPHAPAFPRSEPPPAERPAAAVVIDDPVTAPPSTEPIPFLRNPEPRAALPFDNLAAPSGGDAFDESPPPIPLERYAVMLADRTRFGLTEAQVCEKHQMTPAQKAAAFDYWQARAAAQTALQSRVKATMDRYEATRANEKGQGRSKASLELNQTVGLITSAAPVPALPFDARGGSDRPPQRGTSSPPQAAGAERRAPVSPFDPVATTTSDSLERVKPDEVLPFGKPAQPSNPPPGTVIASVPPGNEAAGPAEQPLSFADDQETLKSPVAPTLSVEQYASLMVDLALNPKGVEETLRRYRLTRLQKAQVDSIWSARLATSLVDRTAFEAACTAYRTWTLQRKADR